MIVICICSTDSQCPIESGKFLFFIQKGKEVHERERELYEKTIFVIKNQRGWYNFSNKLLISMMIEEST